MSNSVEAELRALIDHTGDLDDCAIMNNACRHISRLVRERDRLHQTCVAESKRIASIMDELNKLSEALTEFINENLTLNSRIKRLEGALRELLRGSEVLCNEGHPSDVLREAQIKARAALNEDGE